jgi:CRP-like cAMP-binding protein
MALFKRVPEERLEWTQDYRTSQFRLKARTHLYQEGEQHKYVYTLFDGCIKLYKTLKNGKIQAMRFSSPGDFLGFQGDLSDRMHHGAEAVTDCVLCAFPKERVSKMLCERPEIASELIVKNAKVMAFCQEHLLSTGARSARESIAFTLVEFNHRLKLLKQFHPGNSSFDVDTIPLTQEDLADAVGITPIHVNRTLKQLREEHLIFCGKGKIKLLDEKALQDLAHFDPTMVHDSELF